MEKRLLKLLGQSLAGENSALKLQMNLMAVVQRSLVLRSLAAELCSVAVEQRSLGDVQHAELKTVAAQLS